MTKNSLIANPSGQNIVFYNLLNIVYSAYALSYLNDLKYFDSNEAPPTELTDSSVLSNLVLLTISLELIILIKFSDFNSFSSQQHRSAVSLSTRPTGDHRLNLSSAFRFIQLCLLSIFVLSLLIILLGASDLRNILSTVKLSTVLTLLTIVPLLVSLRKQYAYRSIAGQFACFLSDLAREPLTSSFLIVNFYMHSLAVWLFAFLLKVDWTVNWKRYPITSIIGCLTMSLGLNSLNLIYLALKAGFDRTDRIS